MCDKIKKDDRKSFMKTGRYAYGNFFDIVMMNYEKVFIEVNEHSMINCSMEFKKQTRRNSNEKNHINCDGLFVGWMYKQCQT